MLRAPTPLFSSGKVLVADDEAFSQSIVMRIVRDLGCTNLVSAADGAETLQRLGELGKDIALAMLDFNMPEVNGLDILKRIRTRRAGVPADLRVVMLTGSADHGLVGAALALDVDAFVVKPVSKMALAARLDKVMGETREIKPPAHYDRVDIDAVSKSLLSRKPVGTPRPKAESGLKKGLQIKLEAAYAGGVLAEDIKGPTGELLLGRNTVLTDRLLRRLKELQGVIGIEYVTLYPPGES